MLNSRGWWLAWQSPKGHMSALPKVSTAPGSLGASDRTPTAPRRQAPEPGQAGTPGGPTRGHCCPRSARDHPQAPIVLRQVLSEANCSTRHVSPAQGPPSMPWALHKRVLWASRDETARLRLGKALSFPKALMQTSTLPWAVSLRRRRRPEWLFIPDNQTWGPGPQPRADACTKQLS